MSAPYGDSYSSVQAAEDTQTAQRQQASQQGAQMMLAGAQMAMEREKQHMAFALENRKLDIGQQQANTAEMHWRDMIKWRNSQLQAETALKSKELDVKGMAHGTTDVMGTTMANNYDEAMKEFSDVSDKLETQKRLGDDLNNRALQLEQAGVVKRDPRTGIYTAGPRAVDHSIPYALNASLSKLNEDQGALENHFNAAKQSVDLLRNEAGRMGFAIDHKTGNLVHTSGKVFSPTPDAVDYTPGSAVWGQNAPTASGNASTWSAADPGAATATAAGAGEDFSGDSNHPLASYASQIPGGLDTVNALKAKVDAGQLTPNQAATMVAGGRGDDWDDQSGMGYTPAATNAQDASSWSMPAMPQF